MKKIGKAYGFFDCKASKKAIESELPTIRDFGKTPSKLELSLTEGIDNFITSSSRDRELIAIAEEAKGDGMNYAFEATYHGATNQKSAAELAHLLDMTYASSLYKKGEPFIGQVVYKEGDRYVFRD